jgi:hypothetical protein
VGKNGERKEERERAGFEKIKMRLPSFSLVMKAQMPLFP